jgi:nucleoside-triphosphatase
LTVQTVALGGQQAVLAHVNITSSKRVGKFGVDLQALEDIGVESIYNALNNKALVVIDEIGPMEIASEKFRSALRNVLQSDCTLIGTIVKRSLPFTDDIKRSCKNIIEVDPLNRERIPGEILLSLSEDET